MFQGMKAMFKLWLVFLTFMTLTSCQPRAAVVNFPGESLIHSEYAPVNERRHKIGTVRFKPDRSSARALASAREEAYWRMHSSCGGHYRIINHAYTLHHPNERRYRPRQRTGVAVQELSLSKPIKGAVYFIDYECEPPRRSYR